MTRLLGLLAIALVAGAETTVADSGSIGSINKLENVAYGQPAESPKVQLNLADQVYQNETLETEPDSSLQVSFLDGTTVQLEGASQLVLDQYVYDASTSNGTAALNFGAGVFRFVTGTMNHDGINLETSATTIGIRGTNLRIQVGENGSTIVDVIEGAIVVHPKGSNKETMAVKGQRAIVAGPGEDPVVTTIPKEMDQKDRQIKVAKAPRVDPPAPEPEPEPEPDPTHNHSGQGDDSNPGNSNSNNGGLDNPGNGGNKDRQNDHSEGRGHGHGQGHGQGEGHDAGD